MIVVTGASGGLGKRVAARLDGRVRLLFRDPAKVAAQAEAAVADYADGDAVRRALDGADAVFMVSAAETTLRVDHHRTFIDAAVAAGVRHLVYTSFLGAAPDSTFTLGRDHWHTEERIRRSGLAFTLLRDNLYADFLPNMVGEDGVIRGPAGDGRVSLVARDDVADVAAAVLRDPAAHVARTYDLTGPESVTMAEAAALLGDGTRFHDETIPEAYASRAVYNAPAWQVDAWVSTYTAIAAGDLERVTPDVANLTGHPARSLSDVIGRGR
jgi:uncharacterized protein YbjT (DUF2867 family)